MYNEWIKQPWHEAYIDYISDPIDGRNQKEWCFDNKIDPTSVQRWKKAHRTEIYTEADRRRKGHVAEIRNTNWKNLMGRSEKDTKAIELVFKLLGDLVEKSETTHTYMKTDEKKTRIAELMAKAKAKNEALEKFKLESADAKLPEPGTSGQ